MVSDAMLSIISQSLSEIVDCDQPFGGLNIIAVGDLYQLRPVLGLPVYKNTLLLLWPLFKPFFLRENVRQVDDPDFARFLKRITFGILFPQDIDMLKKRLIDIEIRDVGEALHIFPTRKLVDDYDNLRQKQLSGNHVSITI